MRSFPKNNTVAYWNCFSIHSVKMIAATFIICIIISVEVWGNTDYNIMRIGDRSDHNLTEINKNEVSVNRTAKFLGWWWAIGVGVVRFENSVCAAANGLSGICYTRRQCSTVGGFSSGRCASNIGVCCVVQVSCGATSSNNNTYFSSPNFPNTFAGGSTCTLTIQRCNSDICQVRIDFLSFILSQPNGDGVCINDVMLITGAASPIGRICGQNTGQHIYLDFNNGTDIEITIFTSAAVTLGRQWNLRVAQIGCDSLSRAPSGCLMYYADLTGTVSSFNYGQAANVLLSSAQGVTGTRQLVNMNYGVCVRMAPGYCSIQWSVTAGDPVAFSVSGNTETALTTPPVVPTTGDTDCRSDFVVIPNGMYTLIGATTASQADRYCGNLFLPVTTSSKPFVLTVVTDGNEDGDTANRGFALTYTQQRCGSDLVP